MSEEYLPATQDSHEVEDIELPYFPGSHAIQDEEPDVGEKVPIGQSKQVEISLAPRVVEYFPLMQSVQDADVMVLEYVPAAHKVQLLDPMVE